MSQEWKPCPFCGKSDVNVVSFRFGSGRVQCGGCGARTAVFPAECQAIGRWYARPGEHAAGLAMLRRVRETLLNEDCKCELCVLAVLGQLEAVELAKGGGK